MIRIFYADPTSDSNPTAGTGAGAEGSAELDEKREPLWSRDMPGLKHIRGILYEDAYEAAGLTTNSIFFCFLFVKTHRFAWRANQ